LYFYEVYKPFLQNKEMAAHNELGRKGEDMAVAYLEAKGHRILERNWSSACGEIDIISKHEGCIVFVEVKTRSSTAFGYPEDAVNERRMRRLTSVAIYYVKKNRITAPTRFDIIALVWNKRQLEIEHLEDAFEPR
jgi:putative endonuclease